jgi:hypothetical protein
MRFANRRVTIALLLTVICFAASCGRDRSASEQARDYARLTTGAIKLYTELQPLRSSRLGIEHSDSLLFTFSEDEIHGAVKRLKKLEARFSSLPASNLPARDIDVAAVVIHWLRGEQFALETLQNHRHNPLLYCWMVDEALWGLPSRIAPPYDGELEAYRRRILRIPALLENGARLLDNPASAHLRYAIERIDTLTNDIATLKTVVEKRYGATLDAELERVRAALAHFRGAASNFLPAAHGRLILGADNLSKLFLYSELLNSDPNVLVAEAESHIKRLIAERSSLERHPELGATRPVTRSTAAGEPVASRIERLRAALYASDEGRDSTAQTVVAKPILEFPARIEYLSPINKDPYLSVPASGARGGALILVPPLSAPACRPRLCLSADNASAGDTELMFRILCAAPGMFTPAEARCAARDSIGALFTSETFAEGWRYLALLGLRDDIRKNAPELTARITDDRIAKLARMIIVFRLHAGTWTSDEAARYLVETVGMEREPAAREVLLASTAPEIAWPGISMVLIDEMLKRGGYSPGFSEPNRDLTKLLLASRDLPLALILPRMRDD